MDQATAKMVLGVYRLGHQDAGDPFFAEAMREVEQDPALAAWFEEEQRFDSQVSETLKQTPAPVGLKELILLNAKAAGEPPPIVGQTFWGRQPRVKTWLAMAASLMLAFVLGRQTLPASRPSPVASGRFANANPLVLQAIAYTGKMPALQFVCNDPLVVTRWIEEKSAAMKMGKLIDKPMASMQMIGSGTARWEGKPVIFIALQNGEQMGMLYLVRAADFPDAATGADEIVEKDGWVAETGRSGERLYVLTTKGTRANLRFPMPL